MAKGIKVAVAADSTPHLLYASGKHGAHIQMAGTVPSGFLYLGGSDLAVSGGSVMNGANLPSSLSFPLGPDEALYGLIETGYSAATLTLLATAED